MGKKSEAPPPPDMSAVANASRESAAMSLKLGQEQLQWAKDQFASNKVTTDQVVAMALETQREQNDNARADRARYEDVFQPQEDKLIQDADTYSTQDKKDDMVGKAQAAVGQQFTAARDNATRKLEGYGINPASTRFAALDIGVRANEAAAKAAAGTAAMDRTDAIARELREKAITIGQKLPGQATTEYGSGNSAGTGAVNNNIATTGSGGTTMGTGTQWTGMGDIANGNAANIQSSAYKNQLDAYKTNQSSSSGVGSALGAIAGIGLSTVPGGSMIGKAFGFEEGGAVPDATSGGAVPAGASPTGGKAVDDVAAQLSVGEYIVPKDVVAWKGQEHFQKLIDSSRKASSEATAKPEVRMAVPTAPTVVSRPSAVPMGQAA